MELACFLSEFSLTNSSHTTQLIMRNFSSFFMKLKTLRQEQNTKYYLPSSKRTSCCRKFFPHIWPKRAKKKAIMFLGNFSFDFPKNSLKGELLWYSTSYPKFHVWQNSRSWAIVQNTLDWSDCEGYLRVQYLKNQ